MSTTTETSNPPSKEDDVAGDKYKNYRTTVSYPTGVESSRSNSTFLSLTAIKPYSYFEMQGEIDGRSGEGGDSVLTAIDQWQRYKNANAKTDIRGGKFQALSTDTTIHLYMPNLLVNTKHEYNESSIAWAKSISDIASATSRGYNDGGKGIEGAGAGLEAFVKGVGASLGKNVLSLFDSATGGALAQATGNVVNPKATTVYNGTALRQQTFNFKFKPSNNDEVKNVHDIIQRFRGFSSPSISSAGALASLGVERRSDFLKIPHFWFLEELVASTDVGSVSPNRSLFRFGPAVLTSVVTNYTPDQYWVMFKSGDPVYIELELQFSELIALTQEDILAAKEVAL